MANEFGTVIENRLQDMGWSAARFTVESGLSAAVLASLVGPDQLPAMPEESTLARLAHVLDLPYRELVVAAAVACGLSKDQEGQPTYVLRFVTNEELLAELRRRLVRGRTHDDANRRRMSHLALMQHALTSEAS